MKFTNSEKSWILYDVANSAYTLTVMTVLFPILFIDIATKSGVSSSNATAYTQYAKSIYSLIIAFLAPILGSYADYKDKKKRFFVFFFLLGLVGAFLLSIPGLSWKIILVVYIIATLGYAGANVFYDAFLIDVTTDERMDKVSSHGYGWGYIGSTIPFIIGMIIYALAKFDVIGLDDNIAINIAFVISAVWWGVFTIPILKNVSQIHYIEPEPKPIKMSILRLLKTLRNVKEYKHIFLFLIAYFFYIDGVYTIITAAIPIGKVLGIVDDIMLMGIVLIIQIIAFPCAIAFGALSKKFGSKRMITFGIFIYVLITLIGYNITSAYHMWIIALLVGIAQGGIQSLSRSYFGKMIPKERSNEFFGLFNIFGKFAAILGPILVGIVTQITDRPQNGLLSLNILFIIGLLIFSTLPKDKNIKRINIK